VFLCICFACISNFASAASKNAVTAYLGALLLCFLQYYGWGQLAVLISDFGWFVFIRDLGIEAHYIGISNGVVQVSDLAYYIGLSLFFLALTQRALQKIKAQ
jgi:ABC-2 type transport system permease protein